MDNVHVISLMLDFYSQLLTPRQSDILDLYYNNDYSLGEIAEQLNISRQGAYDNIKRGKMLLNNLEQKLGLVKKHIDRKDRLNKILEHIRNIEIENICDKDKCNIKKAQEEIISLINNVE